MKNETYNGWTNYATWKVNLEVFDGYFNQNETWTAESVESFIDEVVFGNEEGKGLAYRFARAFYEEVNHKEIAEHLNGL